MCANEALTLNFSHVPTCRMRVERALVVEEASATTVWTVTPVGACEEEGCRMGLLTESCTAARASTARGNADGLVLAPTTRFRSLASRFLEFVHLARIILDTGTSGSTGDHVGNLLGRPPP